MVYYEYTMTSKPVWTSYGEIPSVVLHPLNLRRTMRIALVTGLILFAINQLDVVVRDPGSGVAWVKSALCFVVPFCVSNIGVLMGSRIEDGEPVGVLPGSEGGVVE